MSKQSLRTTKLSIFMFSLRPKSPENKKLSAIASKTHRSTSIFCALCSSHTARTHNHMHRQSQNPFRPNPTVHGLLCRSLSLSLHVSFLLSCCIRSARSSDCPLAHAHRTVFTWSLARSRSSQKTASTALYDARRRKRYANNNNNNKPENEPVVL